MAASPTKYKSGLLLSAKSKLADRLSGSFKRKSYANFEASPSIDEFDNETKAYNGTESLNFSPLPFTPPPQSVSSPNLPAYNDYLYTKENYALFYIQFTNVQNGFFKDLINLNSPVQDVIARYSQFFPAITNIHSLNLFVGPRIGVYSKPKFSRVRSVGIKLSHHSSLAEQNVNTGRILVINSPSEASLDKECFHAYLNSKSEHTEFVERWLPVVQGCVPLSVDDACIVGALLYKLNRLQNLETTSRSNPRDFMHSSVQVTKLADTKIAKALERVSDDSIESITKLCQDTILANFLSAAIIFSVNYNTGVSIHPDQPAYLVISSQTILLVRRNDPTKVIYNTQLTDAKSWKHTDKQLDIEYVNKFEQSSSSPGQSSHFIIKSMDSSAISSTLTAVAYALHTLN